MIDKMLSDGFLSIPHPQAIARAAMRHKEVKIKTPNNVRRLMLEISDDDAVELAEEFDHD